MTSVAAAPAALPRRMPRSLAPQPNETLAGYLLNLAHRLAVPPAELAYRTGLETDKAVSIDTGYTVELPHDAAARFGHACNLTPQEVTNLTLARWDGLLFDRTAPSRAARTLHGSGWLSTTFTRACPPCLSTTPNHAPDRVTWQAAWRTPWAVACTTHGVLLEDTCRSCGHRFGQSGNRIGSLVPNALAEPLHPAACRTRPSYSDALCNARLDDQRAVAAPTPVLALQSRLDRLLTGSGSPPATLGVPVSPAQYLRDLRTVAVLLQLADAHQPLTPMPAAYTAALKDHLTERSQRRAARTDNDRSDRTWTEAPTSTRALAALLVQAAHILDLPSAADARDLLPPLIDAATTRERLLWQRIRSAAAPSDGLSRYFAPRLAGTLSPLTLRTATAHRPQYTITADHVPAHLNAEHYQRHFSDFGPAAEGNIRRAVPLTIARLLDTDSLEAAADRLDIPFISAEAAVVRAGRAAERSGRADDFHNLTIAVANGLQAQPTNYGHRRRALSAWTLPDADWTSLREAMLEARVARRDTPWAERRTSVTVWLWVLVTSGDPALAPMIAGTATNGRLSTNGALPAYTTLVRRAQPGLIALITDYAADLTARIDATAPA